MTSSTGRRVSGGGFPFSGGPNCGGGPSAVGSSVTSVWARPLVGGEVAVAFVNVGPLAATVSCDAGCFANIGTLLAKARAVEGRTVRGAATAPCYRIRDLWSRTDNDSVASGHLMVDVDGKNGSVVLLKLAPVHGNSTLSPSPGGGGCPAPAVPPSPHAIPGPQPYRPPKPTPPPPPPFPGSVAVKFAACNPADLKQQWRFQAAAGEQASYSAGDAAAQLVAYNGGAAPGHGHSMCVTMETGLVGMHNCRVVVVACPLFLLT